MGARLPINTNWELDFEEDNVVPIGSGSSARRALGTRRGVPRVMPPGESQATLGERPLTRAPPGRASHVRKVHPVSDPQCEATIEFDPATLPRRAPKEPRRRATHADLDLQFARHDDPLHQSALLVLARQQSEPWQTWFVAGVGALGAIAMLVGFFV